MNRPDWMREAACLHADTETFFPEKGHVSAAAKEICARCDVTAECLAYALRHDINYGTWGGCSERDRRPLKRRTLQPCGTTGAFQRHKAHGEEPCEACWEASRRYRRAS